MGLPYVTSAQAEKISREVAQEEIEKISSNVRGIDVDNPPEGLFDVNGEASIAGSDDIIDYFEKGIIPVGTLNFSSKEDNDKILNFIKKIAKDGIIKYADGTFLLLQYVAYYREELGGIYTCFGCNSNSATGVHVEINLYQGDETSYDYECYLSES